MSEQPLHEKIAPCGLDCSKCLAFAGGPIQRHSQALLELLGPNFGGYAERLARMAPVLDNYPPFRTLLEYLASGSCKGCRQGGCLFKTCRVHVCVREKGVDFCFQCAEFPCRETNFPPQLEERWFKNNQRLKDIGLKAYCELIKDKPRYP